MATNGLSKPEEKLLQRRLQQLEEMRSHIFLTGGNEQRTFHRLIEQIRGRMEPIDPAILDRDFQRFLDTGSLGDAPWVKDALQRAEAA